MKKEHGVSPVIGTILMVAITIVLVATIYALVFSNMITTPYSTAQFIGTLTIDPDTSNRYHINLTVSMSSPNSVSMSFARIGIYHNGNYVLLDYSETSGKWSNYTSGDKWHYEAKIIDLNNNNKLDSGDCIYVYVVDDNPSDTISPPQFQSGDKIVLNLL